ncbi:HD-GYP domain-containing protein [Gorillibacterium sp. sgz5001074]|uniref:HD-GYP domain-containing protein n=1 Tax=Gorillibacterium sp. sgz5001074 TaxID=3446695 RepID=UPI003F66D4EF
MRLLPTKACSPGMKLGKAVYNEEGQILLGARVELSGHLLNRLYQLGFDYLYVEDARTEDVAVPDPISQETRTAALSVISSSYSTFSQDLGFISLHEHAQATKALSDVVGVILDELREAGACETVSLLNFNVLKPNDWNKYSTQNALNCCLYASLMGMMSGLKDDKLKELAMGAILHDIGNSRIPFRLLRKADKLTGTEYKLIQKHTELGYDLLKNDSNVPPGAALCVLQHHERVDGTGYPFGLTGDQIHPAAKWVSLIDAYDAMTNPRSYRSSLLPHHALEVLFAGAGSQFDLSLVEAFRNRVAIYPPGVPVRLNTGERGVVVGINRAIIQRPVVRVLQNERGEELREPYEVDLAKRLSVMIDCIASETA